MNNLYIAYDKFPCQYYLTTFFVISTLVSPRILSISLRNVLSRLFSHEKTHDMCFFTYLYAFTHSFLSVACLPASEMCFLACSPMKKHTTCVYLLICFYTQFSPRCLPISFRDVFSRLFSHGKTHDMCFFTCLYAFTHSFLSATCLSASGMCFPACSPMKKHTTCVFSLTYMLLHTVFSLLPAYQLPRCVFSLALP